MFNFSKNRLYLFLLSEYYMYIVIYSKCAYVTTEKIFPIPINTRKMR